MSRLARGAVLVMVAVAGLTGCSSDTSQQNVYVEQVNTAQKRFEATVNRISSAVTPSRPAGPDRLTRFEGAVEDVVANLRRIDVPADVHNEHTRLVAAIAGFGDDIARANSVLSGSPSRRTLMEAQRAILNAMTSVNSRITAAIEAINRKLGV